MYADESSTKLLRLLLPLQTSVSDNADLADPLIDSGAEDMIYIGVALLTLSIGIGIGLINRKISAAVLIALFISGFMIVLAVAL
jgi:hypothetical protein